MVSDEHSCSCFRKQDSSASEDPIQFHSLDNGFLSVWSVECSSKVAEEAWVVEAIVAVVAEVAANPFEVLQCQVIVVVAVVQVAEVVVAESVYELEQLGAEAMTFFVLHQMKQIRRAILHHHHPYLQHCATLLLPPL